VIFSSGDIISRLGGDPVIRSLARLKIVDGKPPIEAGSGVVIYVSKYPVANELIATWNVWIIDFDNEPLDVLIRQIRRLLPDFTVLEEGVIIKASTTELISDKTQLRPVNTPQKVDQAALDLEQKFEELRQSIEDRMLVVRSGRAGKDGAPGRDGLPGKDGKDGKDLIATDAELNDLKNVYVEDAQRGQFLMFDGASWISRFVPQTFNGPGALGGGTGTGGGIEEAPLDGNFYVRQNGQWVSLTDALTAISNLDAGDFTLGIAETTQPGELNGGDFSP
jgi:hypothetical protein